MPSERIDFDVVREIALELPDVEEGTLHGPPTLKVSGRLLTCPAFHKSAEPNSLVVRIAFVSALCAKPAIGEMAGEKNRLEWSTECT